MKRRRWERHGFNDDGRTPGLGRGRVKSEIFPKTASWEQMDIQMYSKIHLIKRLPLLPSEREIKSHVLVHFPFTKHFQFHYFLPFNFTTKMVTREASWGGWGTPSLYAESCIRVDAVP